MKIRRDLNQGTVEWFNHKLGKITGTVLDDVMGTPKAREGAIYEVISERLTPCVDMDNLHENAMARGSRLEPEAIVAFEYVTGKKIERVGYCEHEDHPHIGYSPDGIVMGTDESEDIEVKCPEGKNYIKIVMTNEVPKEYKRQIIQGFVVNPRLKTRWFVAYNPDVAMNPIHIIEVKREDLEKEIEEALEAQLQFLKEVEEGLEKIKLI